MDMRGGYSEDCEQFFIFSDGSAVNPTHIRETLRDMLTKLNLNPMLYDTHSFRIGKACDMLKANYTITEIKQRGRWASNAVYKYLHQ